MAGVLSLLRRGRRPSLSRHTNGDRGGAAPRCREPAYWQGRSLHQGGRRRISIFARNAYRHGVLGRFIGVSHVAARFYGVDLRQLLTARSIEEQRRFFETMLAPLFDKPAVRWATANRLSLYGLGIPPAQYEALAGGSDMRHVLRSRVERLACGFSLDDNYFAWQAFGRSYAGKAAGPLPPYLRREHFHAVRSRADRVEVMNRSITESRDCPDASRYRYVRSSRRRPPQLDARAQITLRPSGARVIFRTAPSRRCCRPLRSACCDAGAMRRPVARAQLATARRLRGSISMFSRVRCKRRGPDGSIYRRQRTSRTSAQGLPLARL